MQIPFLDALPHTIVGPLLVRVVLIMPTCRHGHKHAPAMLLQMAILMALIKGFAITSCRADPSMCSSLFHDYKVVVLVKLANVATNNTNNTNSSTHMEQRTVLSLLDIMQSCNTVIFILCLQMCPGIPIGVHYAWMLICVAVC